MHIHYVALIIVAALPFVLFTGFELLSMSIRRAAARKSAQ